MNSLSPGFKNDAFADSNVLANGLQQEIKNYMSKKFPETCQFVEKKRQKLGPGVEMTFDKNNNIQLRTASDRDGILSKNRMTHPDSLTMFDQGDNY